MRVSKAHDLDLIHNRFGEILNIPQQVETVSPNTYTAEFNETHIKLKPNPSVDDMKMTGSKEVEVSQTNRKPNKNVIFIHLGFFTIRMLPRKGHTSLLRLFF